MRRVTPGRSAWDACTSAFSTNGGKLQRSVDRDSGVGNRLLLGSLAALSASGHLGYPAVLAVAARDRHPSLAPSVVDWPDVTVVIPAYLEQNVIEAKVADVAAQVYPGKMQIIVVADDPATYAAAQPTGARVLLNQSRVGKSAAVNLGVAAADYEIVVLTDANSSLRPDALTALVRHFADPSVGAVAGAKHVLDGAGQGYYWRFESWLKRRESALGTTIGLVGELAAFRRAAFRSLPNSLVGDDLWFALDVIEGGYRVLFEPAAAAVEAASPTLGVEWERRTRIVSGTIDVIWRRRSLLVPGRSPVAGQLWGHKLLRSTVGPLAHLMLLGSAFRAARRSRLARLTVLGHGLGVVGIRHVARGGSLPGWLALPTQVLFLQAVALGGLLRYLRGDRPALWPKLERQSSVDFLPLPASMPASMPETAAHRGRDLTSVSTAGLNATSAAGANWSRLRRNLAWLDGRGVPGGAQLGTTDCASGTARS